MTEGMGSIEKKMLRVVLDERNLLPLNEEVEFVHGYVIGILSTAKEHFDGHDSIGCIAMAARAAAIALICGLPDDLIQKEFIEDAQDEDGGSVYKVDNLREIIDIARIFCAFVLDEPDIDVAMLQLRMKVIG